MLPTLSCSTTAQGPSRTVQKTFPLNNLSFCIFVFGHFHILSPLILENLSRVSLHLLEELWLPVQSIKKAVPWPLPV